MNLATRRNTRHWQQDAKRRQWTAAAKHSFRGVGRVRCCQHAGRSGRRRTRASTGRESRKPGGGCRALVPRNATGQQCQQLALIVAGAAATTAPDARRGEHTARAHGQRGARQYQHRSRRRRKGVLRGLSRALRERGPAVALAVFPRVSLGVHSRIFGNDRRPGLSYLSASCHPLLTFAFAVLLVFFFFLNGQLVLCSLVMLVTRATYHLPYHLELLGLPGTALKRT